MVEEGTQCIRVSHIYPPEELLRNVTVLILLATDMTVLCGDVSSSEKYALLSSPSLQRKQHSLFPV